MKCYICLTDSIATREDYMALLKVTLISARQHTSLRLVCLYDGKRDDLVYQLLQAYNVEVIFHTLPYKQELMEIYPQSWMEEHLGKAIDYNRIFGTFMRMEIPVVEKEEEYVLYADMDVLFNGDIRLEDLPRPTYLAAAPEFEQDTTQMTYFNAGILLMNVKGMRVKYEAFLEKMRKRERNATNLFDQGYLNELCFEDMELLPNEYNWKPYWGIHPEAKIIHFHGMKPGSQLSEAGFATDASFYRKVFKDNPTGYAGYVYYFIRFFDCLGEKDHPWIYLHLQEIFNLYQNPSFVFPEGDSYRRKYKKYKKRYLGALAAACVSTLLACLVYLL